MSKEMVSGIEQSLQTDDKDTAEVMTPERAVRTGGAYRKADPRMRRCLTQGVAATRVSADSYIYPETERRECYYQEYIGYYLIITDLL
jgi:hypothetical protein